MGKTVQDVINLALSEVGYLEKSRAAYQANPNVLYSKMDGAGYDNYTKYGYEMHKIYPSVMDFPAYWCDSFVDWLFYKTYGIATAKSLLCGDFDDYTVASASMYKNKNAYHKGTAGIAPGDQIFFRNSERINHTGLVVEVSGSSFVSVEGNTSPQGGSESVDPNGGGVWKKTYSLSNTRVDGYGRPPYDKVLTPDYPYWISENGKWYYRIGPNENAHGWMIINGHWYYFDKTGLMLTGYHEIYSDIYGNERYYFETSGDFEGALMQTDDRGALELMDV